MEIWKTSQELCLSGSHMFAMYTHFIEIKWSQFWIIYPGTNIVYSSRNPPWQQFCYACYICILYISSSLHLQHIYCEWEKWICTATCQPLSICLCLHWACFIPSHFLTYFLSWFAFHQHVVFIIMFSAWHQIWVLYFTGLWGAWSVLLLCSAQDKLWNSSMKMSPIGNPL